MTKQEKLKGHLLDGFISARQNCRYFVGIDPGVRTGVAIYDKRLEVLTTVKTFNIVEAQAFLLTWINSLDQEGRSQTFFVLEDARLRKKFQGGTARYQGAGSVKRDSKMWCEFFAQHGLKFYRKAPVAALNNFSTESFEQYTGYKGITSKHSRSAAMLVYKI